MLVATGGAAAPAAADVTCNKVASKSGSDSAAGTLSSPYRTAQKLVNSLSAGQTGCLRQGVYADSSRLGISRGGVAGSPVTLRSYPGERAEIVAHVAVYDSANYVTLTDLVLNGEGAPACGSGSTCTILPSVAINGDNVTVSDSEITNHNTGICINAGTVSTERAVRLTVERNRIYECGRLPETNHDHGIYLGRTNDAQITDNLIYDNADRGIQFYPEGNGSYVARNVIDGNGSGVAFGGASGVAARDNLVEYNLITNSKRWNVYSAYPSGNPIGQNNVVRNNCIAGGGFGEIQSTIGFSVENNLFAAPRYADRAAHDYGLAADDPCQSVLAGQAPSGTNGTSAPPSEGTTGAGGTTEGTTGAGGTSTPGTGTSGTVDTTITKKPKRRTKRSSARFRFESTVSSAGFECKLDGGEWEPCSSPTVYSVHRGTHTFAVRALDVNRGVADPTPATERWVVR